MVSSKQSLTVTEEDATGDRYTVKLATQPSDTVTVTISGHEGADLTLSGMTLTNNRLTFTTTTGARRRRSPLRRATTTTPATSR